jgi:hypothetical protein
LKRLSWSGLKEIISRKAQSQAAKSQSKFLFLCALCTFAPLREIALTAAGFGFRA